MKRPFLTRRPLAAAALCGPLVLLASATASASPTYPGLLKDYFELDEAPPCTLCHKTSAGGFGTLNDDIGKYLKSEAGLKEKLAKDALEKVLAKWDDAHDADDDNAPDIDELKAGTDPLDEDSKPEEEEGGSGGSGGSGDGGSGGKGGSSGKGGSGGKGGGGTNNGLAGQATSAGCSLAEPSGGGGAGGLALAGLAALLARASSGRRRRPG